MNTIDDVIARLDEVILDCSRRNSRQAYFAALYKAMTISVKNQMSTGYFADPIRMEKLDVLFASRYIQAWESYQQGLPCSQSWKTAFNACELSNLVVLQHLLLGINSHINLDLCIAAAETAPGDKIYSLEPDFKKINLLIGELTSVVQVRLETICWPMKLVTRVANGKEKSVINFSIDKARMASWSNAVVLAGFTGDAVTGFVKDLDHSVSIISRAIISPDFLTRIILGFAKWFEPGDVNQITNVLATPIK